MTTDNPATDTAAADPASKPAVDPDAEFAATGRRPEQPELPGHGALVAGPTRDELLREHIAAAAVPALLNYALTHRALNDCILQVAKDAWRVADAVIASRNEPVGA